MNQADYTKQIIEAFIRKYFDDADVLFIVDNDWDYQFKCFTESEAFRSIPQPEPSIPVSKIKDTITDLLTEDIYDPIIQAKI